MKFAIFIISHNRADRVETYTTLKNAGCTENVYVVIDNEDSDMVEYQKRFSGQLLVFDKQQYIDAADTFTVDKIRANPLFARNAVENFAKLMELDVFACFDDDITSLRYRWIEDDKIKSMKIHYTLSDAIQNYMQYIVDVGIATTSFVFSMFFVGGISGLDERVSNYRETWQIHIRNAHRPIEWVGSAMNEDHITELITSKRGDIWWAMPFICYDAIPMDKLKGGGKPVYEAISSINRALVATVALPDCCEPKYSHGKIRIHQNREVTYPQIISSRYKK